MKRRVLYLSLEAPREGQASYVHVHEIINGLRRRGWQVRLLKPRYSETTQPVSVARRLLEHVFLNFRAIFALFSADILYVRSHPLAGLTSWVAKLLGKPVVQEINGPYEDIVTTHPWVRVAFGFVRWMQREQFRSADRLIVVTPALGQWAALQSGHERIELIPNGANTDLFNPTRKGTHAELGRFVVFFGGLARWHRPAIMVAAVASPHWPADVKLVVIGNGQEASVIEQTARVNPNLIHLGRVPYTEVGGYAADALCGLCIIGGERSESGTFPLKLFEILASGIPAIVTDLPGQANLIREEGCGFVVPVDDPDAVALTVARIIAEPETARQMGEKGARLVQERHSWDVRAGDTHAVLHKLVDDQGGA